MTRSTVTKVPIVSSAHLADQQGAELSEFEFGMIIANNAFSRWVVRCMAAAGLPDLTTTEVLILHHVCHRGRNKKLADICFVLNYEDTHVVAYALKKLVQAGVVQAEKHGKEVLYAVTPKGQAVVRRYTEVRERCLIDALSQARSEHARIGELGRTLRALSGAYDQAARAASSL